MAYRRWLIYALGGGFGHLTRACALARAAPPDAQIRILANSPYASCIQRALPELDIVVQDHARIETADCLIVDTFPRGLVGELVDVLPAFSGRKVFVQRDLNPRYAAVYQLDAFIRRFYDLVLVPGYTAPDGLGPFPQTVSTAPWLIRSSSEVLPRDQARTILGLCDDRPCIVVCAAGNPEELAWYGAVVAHLNDCAPAYNIRCIAPIRPDDCPPACWIGYWPAIDLYAAADVLIGGGGYNTVYEAAACGVPLIARAWPRKYDRQNLRARHAARIVASPVEAATAALELHRASRPREGLPRFENGVRQAIVAIQHLLHNPLP